MVFDEFSKHGRGGQGGASIRQCVAYVAGGRVGMVQGTAADSISSVLPSPNHLFNIHKTLPSSIDVYRLTKILLNLVLHSCFVILILSFF